MKIDRFDHQVRWSEFREIQSRPAGVDEDAQISSQTKKMKGSTKKIDGVYRMVDISCTLYVKKAESWVVKGTKTADLLKHEQGHFDITAIGVREMIREMGAARNESLSALSTTIQSIQEDKGKLMQEKSDLYDTQTDHGRIPAEQLRWEKIIKAEKESGEGGLDRLV
jgi:hypothetical protein